MAGYAIGDKVLDGWEIVRLIGEGGYGRVFEVRKGLGSRSSASTSSALKVVSIPPSDSLIESALAEGASREAVAAEYREVADSFMDEAALLSSLSHPGIVGYQDHQSIPHPDGIGWDILLRMELLEPLTRLMSRSPLDVSETVRLGAELADALAFCHARGIIHRDVKPENIFTDASGRYKLGDFGVSRTVEGTSGTLSRKGTEDYMAPELYYEHHYGAPVDIYALGLVLYRLLNGNRLPFLPPAPQPVRYADRQAAQRRRLSGEPFPLPEGCDPALFSIVLCACAHDPASRPSAEELRDGLWEYGHSHGMAPFSKAGAYTAGAGSTGTSPGSAPQPAGTTFQTAAQATVASTQNVWGAFGTQAAPQPKPMTSYSYSKTESTSKTTPTTPKTAPAPKTARANSTRKPSQTKAKTAPTAKTAPAPKTTPAPRRATASQAQRSGKFGTMSPIAIGGLALAFLVILAIAFSGSCSSDVTTSSSTSSTTKTTSTTTKSTSSTTKTNQSGGTSSLTSTTSTSSSSDDYWETGETWTNGYFTVTLPPWWGSDWTVDSGIDEYREAMNATNYYTTFYHGGEKMFTLYERSFAMDADSRVGGTSRGELEFSKSPSLPDRDEKYILTHIES